MSLSAIELVPLLLLPCLPQGDKDLRDVVKTKDGKEVRGRVLRFYDQDEVLVIQGVKPGPGLNAGGKRIRIPRGDVVSIETVNTHLRKFMDQRAEAGNDVDKLWKLVEWADKKGLAAMARLQAMEVVLKKEDHDPAHRYLGHRKRGGRWLWKRKSSYLSRKKYEAKLAKWGTALILPTEHFELKTDAGLQLAVDVAFELEQVYLHWFQLFGKPMQLQEAVAPMSVHLYRDVKRFPVMTFWVKLAYYMPPDAGDIANSFVAPESGEPEQLINVVTQQLIYHTLRTTGTGSSDPRQHVSGWLEYGMGQWMESSFQGRYGRMKLRRPTLDPRQTLVLARMKKLKLKPFLHASYSQFLDFSKRTKERWALSSHLVHYLMEKDHGHREDFLAYMVDVFREGKGDSSTTFARFLKKPLPELERLFQGWLVRQPGGGK